MMAGCEKKANPSVEPFHRAVLRGEVASAARLMAANPGVVRARDEDGLTALHLAAVRLRISPDAAVNPPVASARVGDAACAPVPIFTSYDRRDLRQRLLATGGGDRVTAAAQDVVQTTTLEQRPMAELLIAHGAQVDARTTQQGLTPLHFAVQMGHKGVAEALLEHGADINAPELLGLTALGMAAQAGNTAMVRLLLDRGAPVNRPMKGSFILPVYADDTPLALATVCNQLDAVTLLLDRGASPNQSAHDGFPVLHLAESKEIAELLIERGADVASRGYEGRTPLHHAAMQARRAIVSLLLDHGVDPNAQDKNGDTPLLLALSQPIASAEVIGLLIKHGADVNVRRRSGSSALHAALGRDRKAMEMLLDAGAAVDTPDQYGRTVLHWAVENKNMEIVELLLARGAFVNAKDTTGRTPLYYTWGGSEQAKRIADLLERHGGVGR
jgi:ankyrin repeat protein